MPKRSVKTAETYNVGGQELSIEAIIALAEKNLPRGAGWHDDTKTMSEKDRQYASHKFTRTLATGEEIVFSVKLSGFLQILPDLRFSGTGKDRRSIPGFGGTAKRIAEYAKYFSGPDFKADLKTVLPLAIANEKKAAAAAK